MNLYILVEDGKSGHKIIDQWVPKLIPQLTRAKDVESVTNNHYISFSGFGYPRLLGTNPVSPLKNVLGQTIETINASKKFDYLLIFLDGDEDGVELRKEIVIKKINAYHELLQCPFVVFVQNKCLETWILGNRDYFPQDFGSQFIPFVKHYNVSISDPELMENNPAQHVSTASLYHERYLRQMMKEVGHHYNKSRPAPAILTPEFIEGLKERCEDTTHLRSLQEFFHFMTFLEHEISMESES